MNAEQKIVNWCNEIAETKGCYLVSHNLLANNNYKFFVDSDTVFNLQLCVEINRALRKKIEEENVHGDGDFSLEISSPGIDAPLKLVRQYKKNMGRLIQVKNLEDKLLEGRLKIVEETQITIETLGTKKEPKTEINIPFEQIKTATIQIEFK